MPMLPVPPRLLRRGGLLASCALGLVLSATPAPAGALEPRFDHRDQQGPQAEVLYAKDVVWHGSSDATTSSRGAVRVAWGFDPTGDGDEIFFGSTLAFLGDGPEEERIKLTFDARYRASVGSEELKTLFDIGLWGSAADRLAVGPLVGLGLMYDFNRNFGMLASGFFAAGIGERRVVSFGGGIGAQFRYQ